MRELYKYHAKNIHKWEGGECDFHNQLVCSCGNYEDDELKCCGKVCHTTYVLSCPLHALAYQIERFHRADHAEEIIDPELGKKNSNACEATLIFMVFTKLRLKDVGLQCLHYHHYQASTNLALVQSSMTYLFKR